MQPGEECALVGEEDFGLYTHREGNALAWRERSMWALTSRVALVAVAVARPRDSHIVSWTTSKDGLGIFKTLAVGTEQRCPLIGWISFNHDLNISFTATKLATGRRVGAIGRSRDGGVTAIIGAAEAEIRGGRSPDVNIHLRKPEGEKLHAVLEEGGDTMNKFRKLGNALDLYRQFSHRQQPCHEQKSYQMAVNQLRHPFRWFLARLSLQLHLENGIGKPTDVGLGKLREGIINSNVHPTPVIARSPMVIVIVLANHREFRIKTDADARVAGQLKGSAVVERANNYRRFDRVNEE
ncbi:hypothetical protein BC937DRAFT_94442 [Endogone sp. FLAS-F59071]|nr:hypothetical protein BC937DRAFT_94442 [Endogone sp. FLAS-F59071]|eukprot:RUS20758.1 hypothetical protein BC937DRAFT_94442 [Endogone sp. FLAS-F59071]